jgi:ElaB/YqjD/DUF883 family membrane-anchored ribosome-binding protein
MAERSDVAARRQSVEDGAAERSAETIRHDIEAKRDAISDTVHKLGGKIEDTLDWRTYVSRHPIASLGVAAVGGLLLSRLFARRPSPTDRILDALADTTEEVVDRVRDRIGDALGSGSVAGRTIKAAAAAVISKAAIEFVRNKIDSGWPSNEASAEHRRVQ